MTPPRSRRNRPLLPRGTELANRGFDKGVTRYYRLYELLSVALRDGAIASESALPSEPELCTRYGLSRTTVRRALDRLQREGRVIRRRGSGTFARPQPAPQRLCLELHALRETFAQLESHTTATTLRFTPAVVPAALRAVAPEIGSTARLFEQLRRSGREPLLLIEAYLPETRGRRLEPFLAGRASILSMLDRSGHPTARATCSLSAIPADVAAAGALEVPLGAPLLRIRAVLTDDRGRLRAAMDILCRSDRLQLKLREPLRSDGGSGRRRASGE